MKTEVYSWRVSTDLKTGLEREAHRRKQSLAAVLDLAARDWLSSNAADKGGDEEQRRLHNTASKYFGAFAGENSDRSANVRELVRQRLQRRRDR